MISSTQLIRFLQKHPNENVWIDEGGLTIETESGGYLEVGGQPLEEDEE